MGFIQLSENVDFWKKRLESRSRLILSCGLARIRSTSPVPNESKPVDTLDQYSPPQAEVSKPLGSLAQSARGKEIKQAQWILIAIGLLTGAFNGFMLYNTPNEVADVMKQQNFGANAEEVRQFVTTFCYSLYGGLIGLGVLFVIFGLVVKSYPVPITVAGLILYIGVNAGLAFLNPATIAGGLIVKIFIIVGLFRAFKAARAYERQPV